VSLHHSNPTQTGETPSMSRWIVASSNQGKMAEMTHWFRDKPVSLIGQTALGILDAEETGKSFVENALLKARHAAHHSGLPALADDSGLVVDALQGAPGLLSARYSGTHGDAQGNIDKLLSNLSGLPEQHRSAYFYSVIVLLRHANDPAPLIAEGIWHGRILEQRLGTSGFGYDPVFYVPSHACSAAQLNTEVKNKISHRGQALAMLWATWNAYMAKQARVSTQP
jgi:XTP/dITP diphosphohydrolase